MKNLDKKQIKIFWIGFTKLLTRRVLQFEGNRTVRQKYLMKAVLQKLKINSNLIEILQNVLQKQRCIKNFRTIKNNAKKSKKVYCCRIQFQIFVFSSYDSKLLVLYQVNKHFDFKTEFIVSWSFISKYHLSQENPLNKYPTKYQNFSYFWRKKILTLRAWMKSRAGIMNI